jgi:pimeloyl-ACP methyl ester carboxylesterase
MIAKDCANGRKNTSLSKRCSTYPTIRARCSIGSASATTEAFRTRVAPKLLLHGEPRPVAIVLFHGIAASPQQFVRFAHELHERGHNVIVPRLPRHGHRKPPYQLRLRGLQADDLRTFATQSIELAQGLGEHVVVAGFSLGRTARDMGGTALSNRSRRRDRAVLRDVVDADAPYRAIC